MAVKRILAVPEPSGRAVTWAREAADRFEAELAVFALDPEEPDPSAAIVREASERGCDLIVLSDAGMRDRTEFLLANVANRVSHAARCSVVFVADGSEPATAEEPRERLLGRATEIGRVFARHGLRDDRPAADRARRLREALEELGPTFAKLGQVLSTRPDLLPPEYIAELARLQDDMPPLTQAEVVTVLEAELGVPWEDAFAHIEPTPLAAGTIAQVHRATLPAGSRVVLKVQRPSAERQILEDLALLELFAEKAGNRPAFGRVVDLPAVFAYLAESLRRELDFSIEAASIERIRPLLADFDRLAAPARAHGALDPAPARDGGGRRRQRERGGARGGPPRGGAPAALLLLPAGPRRGLLPRRPAPRQPALGRRAGVVPRLRHGRRARARRPRCCSCCS